LHENHLGNEFTGIITGFTSRGIFVSLERFLVEGLAQFEMMQSKSNKSNRWDEVPGTGRIVAQRSGAVLSIGDRVKVQISAIDLAAREMELRITKTPERHIDDLGYERTEIKRSKRGGRKKSNSKRKGRGRKRK
jgi:ribonuclease R